MPYRERTAQTSGGSGLRQWKAWYAMCVKAKAFFATCVLMVYSPVDELNRIQQEAACLVSCGAALVMSAMRYAAVSFCDRVCHNCDKGEKLTEKRRPGKSMPECHVRIDANACSGSSSSKTHIASIYVRSRQASE